VVVKLGLVARLCNSFGVMLGGWKSSSKRGWGRRVVIGAGVWCVMW